MRLLWGVAGQCIEYLPYRAHWLGVGVTASGVGIAAVGVGLAIGTAVAMMRVGNGVGSADPRNVWGPTRLRMKLSTMTMLNTAVMILALRLLPFCRLDLDRLNLSSRFA